MAADLNLLVPDFRPKAEAVIAACAALGVTMRPSEGLRDPFVQGKYWRQSRSSEEIKKKVAELKAKGCAFLAYCITSVGPQSGPPITKSIPGLSWHQWGEALDCFWLVNSKAVWDDALLVNGKNGYKVYAAEAKKAGLEAGAYWTNFPDTPHIQLRATSAPSKLFTLVQIDKEMKKRFG